MAMFGRLSNSLRNQSDPVQPNSLSFIKQIKQTSMLMQRSDSFRQVNWREILVFYIVAVVVSAPFRLHLIVLQDWLPLPAGFNVFYQVLKGIGPLAGFLVAVYLLRSRVNRKISFFGPDKVNALAIFTIPIGLTLCGVNNELGLDRNYYGLLVGLMLVLYALGEEFGWRGYLQQALAPLSAPVQVFVIAGLWYVWHLNFLLPGISWKVHLIHFISLVLGAWGLKKIADTTGSILFVAAVHLSFNLLSDVNTDVKSKLLILICSAVVWTVLIIRTATREKKRRTVPRQ